MTMPGNPHDLSLCGRCLALHIADATGIRSALREQWAFRTMRATDQREKQHAELGKNAREGLARTAGLFRPEQRETI